VFRFSFNVEARHEMPEDSEQDSTYGCVEPMKKMAFKSLVRDTDSSQKVMTSSDDNAARENQTAKEVDLNVSNRDDCNKKRLQNIDQLLEESLEDEQLSQYEMPISGSLKRDWGKLPFYDYPTD
jgi:hypothetical protein